jgi:hypothetical protein
MDSACLGYAPSVLLNSSLSFDTDEGSSLAVLKSSENFCAVSSGTALTITRKSSHEIEAEIDFSCPITEIAWAIGEKCAVLADVDGVLHLVTVNGTVLFSKKIASGTVSD